MSSIHNIKASIYQQNMHSIEAVQKYGLNGVKIQDQRLVMCSWREWICNLLSPLKKRTSRI